jgi:hypothetical protein
MQKEDFMKANKTTILLMIFLMTVVAGCAMMVPQPSAEQMERQRQILSSIYNRQQQQQQKQPESPQEPFVSEDDLAKKIASLPTVTRGIDFVQKKDGFEYNGKRYLDPEGVIVSYGFDPMTGNATYLAQTSDNAFVIKFVRVGTNTDPITIARADNSNAAWTVQTVTGKKLSGLAVTPLSRGFAVTRDATTFIYSPGAALNSVAAPDGFTIADFQHGEVEQTRYVLVERIVDDSDAGGLKGVINKTKSLGATLGLNKKEDYILVNIDDNSKIPLNIDVDGKSIAVHSNCKKKNAFINDCKNVNFYQSLYQDNGLPNSSHYYWQIAWFNGQAGPFFVIKEGSSVYIQDIKTGKRVEALHRTLGINWMIARRTSEGKVEINAQLGFSRETVADSEKILYGNGQVAGK